MDRPVLVKVWCRTCEHEHVPNMPEITYQCRECGFGGWDEELALQHERSLWPNPDHHTFRVGHLLEPLAGQVATGRVHGHP